MLTIFTISLGCRSKVTSDQTKLAPAGIKVSVVNPTEKKELDVQNGKVTIDPGVFDEPVSVEIKEMEDASKVEDNTDQPLATKPIQITVTDLFGNPIDPTQVQKEILVTFSLQKPSNPERLRGLIITQPENIIIEIQNSDLMIQERENDMIDVTIKTKQVNAIFCLVMGDEVVATADTAPPDMPIVSGLEITNNKRPTWTWVSGGGEGAGAFRIKLDLDLFTAADALTEATSFTPPTDLIEGEHTLYVQETDEAGNWSESGSYKITIDATPPTNTSILINANNTYTTSSNITLTLAASEASEMYVTNTEGCTAGGSWVPYNSSSTWTLDQQNSIATVYVKFRDLASNESSCISDLIIHDNQPPVPGNSGAIASSNISYTQATISWNAATDANGPVQYAVYFSGATDVEFIEAWGIKVMDYAPGVLTLDMTDLIPAMPYVVNIVAKDALGQKIAYTPTEFTTLTPQVKTGLSNLDATANGSEKKTFFDATNSKHWAFFYDGSGIRYAYSSDIYSWTEPAAQSLVGYNTGRFTVYYKSPYVFVAIQNGFDIIIHRGFLTPTSITFDSALTPLDGTSSSDSYLYPSLAIDGTNKIVVAAFHKSSESYRARVKQSTNTYDQDLSSWAASTDVGESAGDVSGLSLLSTGGGSGELMLITHSGGEKILCFKFDGSTWTASSGTAKDWFSLANSDTLNNAVRAIAISGTDLYIGGSFTYIDEKKVNYVAKWNGTTWSALGPGVNNVVYSIAVSGNDVYVGGDFSEAGGVPAAFIAKWNGFSWSSLGAAAGFGNRVNAIAIIGTDVYAGGAFWGSTDNGCLNGIARWDGSVWSNITGDCNPNTINALTVSGTDLYIGGNLILPPGVSYSVAKWNGTTLVGLGDVFNGGNVFALAASGTDVYAGGDFTMIGALTVNRIAKWDGSSWSELGGGLAGGTDFVSSIAVSGTDVYVGGVISSLGGSGIAKWDGSTWSNIQFGVLMDSMPRVLKMSGTDLYVGGEFRMIGANYIDFLAKWDGANWSNIGPQGTLNGSISAMTMDGTDLYVGGFFTKIGGVTANYIAKFDGLNWSALGLGTNGPVTDIVISGTDIYVGGQFSEAGGASANCIAKWNGSAWSTLGTGLDFRVNKIAISGTNIYVGGSFNNAGGGAAANVAKWNGSAWSALGSGTDHEVYALAVSGTDLYVGGYFTNAGGVLVNKIAKWNGSTWSALGTGLSAGGSAQTITVSGSDIYVGGSFTTAGGVNAANIAKWNGTNWSALGSGAVSAVGDSAFSGTDLYVLSNTNVSKWNGTEWSISSTLPSGYPSEIEISSTDDLYIGGFNYVMKYMPVVASGVSFSAAYNEFSDELGIFYIDSNHEPGFRTWTSAGGWGASSPNSMGGTSLGPTLSVTTSSDYFYAVWSRNGILQYTPYSQESWQVAEFSYIPRGEEFSGNPATDMVLDGGKFHVIWTKTSSGGGYEIGSALMP